MCKKPNLALSVILCLSMLSALAAQPDERYIVLPQSKVEQLPLCSRLGPKVAGIWSPSAQDVLDLESKLGNISQLRVGGAVSGEHVKHPELSLRQYLGIVVGDRKLIYINGIPNDLAPKDWHEKFVTICDGGASVWGALYDPQTKTFSDLEANGVA